MLEMICNLNFGHYNTCDFPILRVRLGMQQKVIPYMGYNNRELLWSKPQKLGARPRQAYLLIFGSSRIMYGPEHYNFFYPFRELSAFFCVFNYT